MSPISIGFNGEPIARVHGGETTTPRVINIINRIPISTPLIRSGGIRGPEKAVSDNKLSRFEIYCGASVPPHRIPISYLLHVTNPSSKLCCSTQRSSTISVFVFTHPFIVRLLSRYIDSAYQWKRKVVVMFCKGTAIGFMYMFVVKVEFRLNSSWDLFEE